MSIDTQALREAADAANKSSWGRWEAYHPHKGARGYEVKVGVKAIAQHCLKVDAEFIATANPVTVLALLDALEAAEKRISEFGGHLKSAHAFIENTEAFGHEAASGILKCGDSEWNVDASKESLAAAGISVKGE